MNTNEIELLKTSQVKRALIAYAGTKDGDTTAKILSKQLTAVGIQCYRVEFNQALDANGYALAHSPANMSLGDVIRKAVWMGTDKPPAESSSDKTIDDESHNSVDTNLGLDSSQQDDANTIPTSINIDVDEKYNNTFIPATVLPTPAVEVDADIKGNVIIMCFDNCRYRIRGLEK